MQTLLQDIRYALRQLRHAPAFTLTALLTLAIGIGATTAIFTLTQAIMLKSLPVADPAQLFEIRSWDPHVFGFSILALGVSAATAGILPAHRAASTDPLKALRTD